MNIREEVSNNINLLQNLYFLQVFVGQFPTGRIGRNMKILYECCQEEQSSLKFSGQQIWSRIPWRKLCSGRSVRFSRNRPANCIGAKTSEVSYENIMSG